MGHLELEKVLQSKEFTTATPKLANQIKAAYGVKTVSQEPQSEASRMLDVIARLLVMGVSTGFILRYDN